MRLLLIIILNINNVIIFAQTSISIGGGLGYNHCFYLNRNDSSKFLNPEFFINFNTQIYSENLFWAGLQLVTQERGIRVFSESVSTKNVFNFKVYETRFGLITGTKIHKENYSINPYIGLNISSIRNDFFSFENDNKYYIPNEYFSKLNPSFEIGSVIIYTNNENSKVSLWNQICIRYYPFSYFNVGNFVKYKAENGNEITTSNYNKLLDISFCMAINYNRRFRK